MDKSKGGHGKQGGAVRIWWGTPCRLFYPQKVNSLHAKTNSRGTIVETQVDLGETDIVRTKYDADASEIGGHSRCA